MSRTKKVLDTNVILNDANNVIYLGADESIIVIPETVVDELDSKKTELGEIGYQAREFGRIITRASKELPVVRFENLIIHRYVCDGTEIHIVALEEYPDLSKVHPKNVNDRKIIEVALQLEKYLEEKVIFITEDVMCAIRAESLGLTTEMIKEVDKTDFEFIKKLDVNYDTFVNLHKKHIKEVDPEYTLENYNYEFYCEEAGYIKLGYIQNDLVNIIGKETEADLSRQDLAPINAGQKFLSRAILDPNIDIVVCEAKAGSGKTAVSISNAIRLLKTKCNYEGIIYVRASVNDVDKVEEVGFLPGLEEKFAPFLHPLNDVLVHIVKENNKSSKLKGEELTKMIDEKVQDMRKQYNIEAMTTLGMRGRTFSGVVAIIDEAQNMSASSMQKVLTRFGKNCKLIIIGSNRQIDNPYLTKYSNGLSVLLEDCTISDEKVRKFAVNLQKVVRSPIAEWAENLFSATNSK